MSDGSICHRAGTRSARSLRPPHRFSKGPRPRTPIVPPIAGTSRRDRLLPVRLFQGAPRSFPVRDRMAYASTPTIPPFPPRDPRADGPKRPSLRMLLTSMVLFPGGTASLWSAFSRGRTGNFQRGIEPQTRRSTPLQRHRAHALPAARELTGICMKILRSHIAESLAMKIIPKPHHALKSSFMDESAPLARSS